MVVSPIYYFARYSRSCPMNNLLRVPETISMKGLVLTNMGRKDEGLDLVRKGVRLDLTSHICWHVLGLVHKADRNYEEALKCYTQALRFDKVSHADQNLATTLSYKLLIGRKI